MSLYEYNQSKDLAARGDFYGLIMAAMRNADNLNVRKLKQAWPEIWDELQARYNAPEGLLADEKVESERA